MSKGLRITVTVGLRWITVTVDLTALHKNANYARAFSIRSMISNVVFVSLQDLLESVNPIVEYRPI